MEYHNIFQCVKTMKRNFLRMKKRKEKPHPFECLWQIDTKPGMQLKRELIGENAKGDSSV